ncbi:MAG TPA: hypothetical protein VN426_11530 [Syntrophomonadaceae bacterium]|nr:hypothetical protein [Syntrophomonadaceae bacterium]
MPNYKHLLHMTDKTGILQFSHLSSPDPSSGYTLDDNARAFMVAVYMEDGEPWAKIYIRNLHQAQQPDGSWSNLLVAGQYSSSQNSQDSIGRALLACSIGLQCPWPQIKETCEELLIHHLPETVKFTSPRAIAYSLLALSGGGAAHLSDNRTLLLAQKLSDFLLGLYQAKHDRGWLWFEDYITYCNAIIPQALLAAYQVGGDKKHLKVGRDSLNFLNNILFRDGYLNIIGNQGWYQKGGKVPLFDQQPVDAASVAFACLQAYQVLGTREYFDLAKLACHWYRGRNIHNVHLVDSESGGCYDALTPEGFNRNQGAEAVLSLLMSDMFTEGILTPGIEEERSSSG